VPAEGRTERLVVVSAKPVCPASRGQTRAPIAEVVGDRIRMGSMIDVRRNVTSVLAPALALFIAGAVSVAAQRPASRPAAAAPAPASRPADPAVVVAEFRALVEARRHADAWRRVDVLRAALNLPEATREQRREGDRLAIVAGLEVVGAAAGFYGVTTSSKPGVVETTYDPSVAGWQEDFEIVRLLPAAAFATRKGAVVSGTGALCQRALWADDVRLEVEGRARGDHDFGPVLLDPDEQGAERFLTGFFNNTYFGVKYDEGRKISEGHLLLYAGRGSGSLAKAHPTQLLGAVVEPKIVRDDEVRCALSLRRTKAEFVVGAYAKPGAKLTFDLVEGKQTFRRLQAGVLVRQSAFEISRITIRGKLDPQWADEEKARLAAATSK
jgi:hypothetical protein